LENRRVAEGAAPAGKPIDRSFAGPGKLKAPHQQQQKRRQDQKRDHGEKHRDADRRRLNPEQSGLRNGIGGGNFGHRLSRGLSARLVDCLKNSPDNSFAVPPKSPLPLFSKEGFKVLNRKLPL
jgi:hypothetical protein